MYFIILLYSLLMWIFFSIKMFLTVCWSYILLYLFDSYCRHIKLSLVKCSIHMLFSFVSEIPIVFIQLFIFPSTYQIDWSFALKIFSILNFKKINIVKYLHCTAMHSDKNHYRHTYSYKIQILAKFGSNVYRYCRLSVVMKKHSTLRLCFFFFVLRLFRSSRQERNLFFSFLATRVRPFMTSRSFREEFYFTCQHRVPGAI